MTQFKHFMAMAFIGTAFAMPAQAQLIPEEMCVIFGDASTEIAASRIAGSSEQDAMLEFAKNNADSPLLALQLVPFVSNFVYGLSEQQLAGDVATPFVEQCKTYKG